MTRRRVGYSLVAATSVIALLPVWFGWPGPLRVPAGLLLGLVLPGLAALALLDTDLRPTATLAAAFALSIATLVLVGLVLGAAHLGFAPRTWALTLALLSLVLAAGALWRGRAHDERSSRRRALGVRPGDWGAYALAGTLTVLAVALAHRSASEHLSAASLPEIWLSSPMPNSVRVGVGNAGSAERPFQILLAMPGWHATLSLRLGARVSRTQSVRVPSATRAQRLTAELRQPGNSPVGVSATLEIPASASPHRPETQLRPRRRRRPSTKRRVRQARRHG